MRAQYWRALALVPGLLSPSCSAAVSLTQSDAAESTTTVARPGSPSVPRGLDLYMAAPDDNEVTDAKLVLGRRLFFEPALSRQGSTSCAACHDPARAFTDGRPTARGGVGGRSSRNVPTIVNRGYGRVFSWDGRFSTLEQQVLGPITSRTEMGADMGVVVQRLSGDSWYSGAFHAAFADGVSERNLARALATFVRSVVSADAPVDRFRDREDAALSNEARLGLRLFVGKGNCWLCHTGPNFSDERFHNTGVAWDGRRLRDRGRARVTGEAADEGAFKTPTLREISRTAPYMHDGSLKRLEDVVEFYARGGRPNPNLDPLVTPLGLTPAEKRALVAFLRALSGRVRG